MWQDHIIVLAGLAGFGNFPLPGLVVALDGVTGLSRFATRKLNSLDARDLVLFVFVAAMFAYGQVYGYFALIPWRIQMLATDFIGDSAPAAARRAYHHREELRMMYIYSFHVVQFISALVCGVLARLQGRSYFTWIAMGYMGSWGAVIWLLINRHKAGDANPQAAS